MKYTLEEVKNRVTKYGLLIAYADDITWNFEEPEHDIALVKLKEWCDSNHFGFGINTDNNMPAVMVGIYPVKRTRYSG